MQTPQKTGDGRREYRVTQRVPILDLDLLVLVGSNIAISTGALLTLAKARVPVVVHGREAHLHATPPFLQAYAEARLAQYELVTRNHAKKHQLATKLIEAKIAGMHNLAEHLHSIGWSKSKPSRDELKQALSEVKSTATARELLEAEAKWSKHYWQYIAEAIPDNYNFPGRKPRNPDPINQAVSYTYAILYTLCRHALTAAGLDPHLGLLHTERPGSQPLTYDYSEPYKPAAIHAVIKAARATQLQLDKNTQHLNKESLAVTTAALWRTLKTKPQGWKHTIKGTIYTKAWELREAITSNKQYKQPAYRPK